VGYRVSKGEIEMSEDFEMRCKELRERVKNIEQLVSSLKLEMNRALIELLELQRKYHAFESDVK
jgi:hypothetical protein